MVIEKAPSCNSIEVVNIVKSLVPGGKCVVDAGAELSLILPSQQTAKFPPLFEKLECTYVRILSESAVALSVYIGLVHAAPPTLNINLSWLFLLFYRNLLHVHTSNKKKYIFCLFSSKVGARDCRVWSVSDHHGGSFLEGQGGH